MQSVAGGWRKGWPLCTRPASFSVLLIYGLLIAAAVILVRRTARRWWDYLLILALAGLLFRPLYNLISGDVSRYLPAFLWSDSSDGKDQIIFASIGSTFLLPVVVSSLILLMVKRVMAIGRT